MFDRENLFALPNTEKQLVQSGKWQLNCCFPLTATLAGTTFTFAISQRGHARYR